MQFYLISDNRDTLVGMRLAGISGTVVHEAEETRAALDAAAQDEKIGVVLITEELGKLIPDTLKEYKLKRIRPIVIEIPDRHGSGRAADSITRYVRQAVGMKM